MRPRVIVAGSVSGIGAVVEATREIPIVFVGGQNALPRGVVQSVARPGGTVTGFSLGADPRLIDKRLEILKDLVPSARRVAAIYSANEASEVEAIAHLHDAAPLLGLAVENFTVRDARDYASAFAAAARTADAFYVGQDTLTFANRAEIARLAAATHLPAIYGFRDFVEVGGLMSYGVVLADLYRRAAGYAARILRGERPAEMPVQLPIKFELVVNLVTAKAIGLALPQAIVVRADEVIE